MGREAAGPSTLLSLLLAAGLPLACTELEAPWNEPEPPAGNEPTPGVPPPSGPSDPDAPLPDNEYCRTVSAVSPEHAAAELEIVQLTNEARAQGRNCGGRAFAPVAPLVMTPALRCAARAHSQDMIDRKFFDHTNPSGESVVERVARTGYRARNWGENIAAGGATARQALDQWLGSVGHCRNLMDGNYRQIGVGYRPGGSYRHYWTQVFGTAR